MARYVGFPKYEPEIGEQLAMIKPSREKKTALQPPSTGRPSGYDDDGENRGYAY